MEPTEEELPFFVEKFIDVFLDIFGQELGSYLYLYYEDDIFKIIPIEGMDDFSIGLVLGRIGASFEAINLPYIIHEDKSMSINKSQTVNKFFLSNQIN